MFSLQKWRNLPNLGFKSRQAPSPQSKELSYVYGDSRRAHYPVILHGYLRFSWETIPSSRDCLIWSSHFLSQTWNLLLCLLKTEPSHLQSSEPCPRDQLGEMYKCKWKTFVSCSLSRNCFLNHWAKHRRMYKYICSANRSLFYYIFLFLPSVSLFLLGMHSECKLSWLLFF